MAKKSNVQDRICSVFEENDILTTKEIIKRVSENYSDISEKQIYNFLWNAVRKGMFCRNGEGKYYLNKTAGRYGVLQNKMYDELKQEIEEICEKYMEKVEDPFEKFKGAELLEAQKVYDKIKSIRKVL